MARLREFSDYQLWNPKDIDWEDIPISKRPMVTVKNPPFSRQLWTHVVFTIENAKSIDGGEGRACLYLNGKPRGSLQQPMQFSWNQENVAIMIGNDYIGYFDDLAIFNRCFTAEEVLHLYQRPNGI